MPRINIDDDFWERASLLSVKLGSQNVAVGQALVFIKLAQTRFKQGRIVTTDDFRVHELSEHLVPIFAEAIEGGYRLYEEDRHFGWLKSRSEAGKKGGLESGKNRRSKIDNLDEAKQSKSKQPEPSPSYSPSYSSSSSSSNSKNSRESGDSLPRLAEIWNERTKSVPKVQKTTKSRANAEKRILAKLPVDEWATICEKVEASDFLAGRSGKWSATFDWLTNETNLSKVREGNYDNKANGESKLKGDFWIERAIAVRAAFKKFGQYDSAASTGIPEILGAELFKMACHVSGGTSAIRNLPNNEFADRKLASMLKEASEKLKAEKIEQSEVQK